MKIKAMCQMDLVGCRRETEIEVDDDCTDEEIDEIVQQWMWNHVEWGWEKA